MEDLNLWINTKDYSVAQLLWNGVGCLFWVVTYVVLVKEIVVRKYVEMPFFIAIGNISWELIWGFFYHPNTGKLFALSYQGAFFLDLIIFFFVLKYGFKQINIPEIQKYFKPIAFSLLVMWIYLNYFFVKEGFDTNIGANSGYILNVIISLLYPLLLLRGDVKNFSKVVAWCKFIGTSCISVSMFLIYPENYFIQTLAISCFILDLSYALLLKNKLAHASS